VSDTHSGQGAGSQGSGAQGGGQQPAAGAPAPQSGQPQGGQQQQPVDRTRGHSPARDLRERLASQQQQDPQDGQQQQAPAAGGDEKIKFGDQELTVAELADLRKFKGEQDSRALTLPPTPEAYELKVPENFALPAGVSKFEFNQADPFLAQARQLAHRDKISQSSFSEILGLYAAERISEATKINTARTAEIAKLGSLAPSRIDAVKTWAHGTLGSELGGAIEQMLVTAKHVEAFEKIINNFSRQGGTQFSQAHREGEPPAGKIPGYAEMSFEQRRAAQMNQNPQVPRTYRAPDR
jgi:hypothetical protein